MIKFKVALLSLLVIGMPVLAGDHTHIYKFKPVLFGENNFDETKGDLQVGLVASLPAFKEALDSGNVLQAKRYLNIINVLLGQNDFAVFDTVFVTDKKLAGLWKTTYGIDYVTSYLQDPAQGSNLVHIEMALYQLDLMSIDQLAKLDLNSKENYLYEYLTNMKKSFAADQVDMAYVKCFDVAFKTKLQALIAQNQLESFNVKQFVQEVQLEALSSSEDDTEYEIDLDFDISESDAKSKLVKKALLAGLGVASAGLYAVLRSR